MARRKRHAATLRAKATLEAQRGEQAVAESATRFDVCLMLIHRWKRLPLEGALGVFECGGTSKVPKVDAEAVRDLHAKIGKFPVAGHPPQGLRGPIEAAAPAPMSRVLVPWGGT